MKLGIVSCYFINNYGSVLQSFATQEFLRSKKIECDTVSVEKLKPYLSSKKKQYYVRSLLNPGFYLSKIPMFKLKILQKMNFKKLGDARREREAKFAEFRKKIILSEKEASSFEELTQLSLGYDAFVVGSDQLWRPDNIFPDYYTLSWVPDSIPKYSYATSFGVSALDAYSTKTAKKFLKRFSAVSVREKGGSELIKDLTGIPASWVCDPVFLLSGRQWEAVCDTSLCPEGKYIFSYFLGKNKQCRKFVRELSKKTGLPVVGIIHNDSYAALDEKIDYPITAGSPADFLGLIKNAEHVCTDSFHATAFSAIFNRNFYVFNRFKSKKHGTNQRVKSLLEMLNLHERLIPDDENGLKDVLSNIDYVPVKEKLESFINKSREFIERYIINGEKNTCKRKVLHLTLRSTIGGIESFQKNLFDNVGKDAASFEFVTVRPDCRLIDYFENNGGKVHILPQEKTVLPYCKALFKIMKENKYDAVHIHKNSCANPMAFIIARMAKVPMIIAHAHNTASVGGKIADFVHHLFRPLVRHLSDVKLACSKEAGEWIFGRKYARAHDIPIVKNGIDINRFSFNKAVRDEVRSEYGWTDKTVFGHVGNFIPQKNHKFMVDITSEALKLNKDVITVFFGGGSAMEDIKKYAEEKSVKDNIVFMGPRADIHRFYQSMDLFLFPSIHEGLPIAGIEAQTADLPCLFSDAISPEITLTDRANSMSLEKSATAWAEKALELCENSNRNNVSDKITSCGFNAENTGKHMEKIYGCK